MNNQTIDFNIAQGEIPEVKINGEMLGVVTCSYQWATKSETNNTQCLLVVNGLLANKKVDLMLNESTGEVFIQMYDCFEC